MFPRDTGKNKNGTAIKVMQSYTESHYERTLASQPKLGMLYVGNVATSAALLFSGNQFVEVARVKNTSPGNVTNFREKHPTMKHVNTQ